MEIQLQYDMGLIEIIESICPISKPKTCSIISQFLIPTYLIHSTFFFAGLVWSISMATLAWPCNHLSHSPPASASAFKIDSINNQSRNSLLGISSSIDQTITKYPISITKRHLYQSTTPYATSNRPRGFGAPPKTREKTKKPNTGSEEEDEEAREEGVIPEIVTNRMISRMGLSVGIPLFVGVLFFPFFYYLKVIQKIDVPSWVPFIVSFIFFGTALLGVSYGIVSSSWDPLREGSLLGWNEAQKNWPVFWQSLWGRSSKK